MSPRAAAEVPRGYKERALFVAEGAIVVQGVRFRAGKMLILGADARHFCAEVRSSVMVLGGDPLGERYLYWNFVSSSKERIAQAAADWRAGRMKLPDADDEQFIPLSDEPGPRQ